MKEGSLVSQEFKDMTEFDSNFGKNKTSIERIQDIFRMLEDENSGIENIFTKSVENIPEYDSRNIYYGKVGITASNTLNIYKGDVIWKQCPIIYYADGGIEFITGFGGTGTESPSSIVTIIPPQGKGIEYWQKITNEKIKKYLVEKK